MVGALLPHHELGDVPGLRRRRPRHGLGVRGGAAARPQLAPCSRAARGRCSASRWTSRCSTRTPRASTSPTSAASTARRACCATSWGCGCCRRAAARSSRPARAGYEDLLRLAEAASDDVPLFDPDDEDLLRPGDMPEAHRERVRARGAAGSGLDRRARAQHPRLAGLQVPARARGPRAGHGPQHRDDPRDRRRCAQRRALPDHGRRARAARAGGAGRGDRARQRARPGARGGRALQPRGDARGRRRLGAARDLRAARRRGRRRHLRALPAGHGACRLTRGRRRDRAR